MVQELGHCKQRAPVQKSDSARLHLHRLLTQIIPGKSHAEMQLLSNLPATKQPEARTWLHRSVTTSAHPSMCDRPVSRVTESTKNACVKAQRNDSCKRGVQRRFSFLGMAPWQHAALTKYEADLQMVSVCQCGSHVPLSSSDFIPEMRATARRDKFFVAVFFFI